MRAALPICVAGLAAFARAQYEIRPADFSTWFNITEFPNAQSENVSYWQAEAYKTAGWDLYYWYQSRCLIQQKYPALASLADGFIAPARAFDSVYFLGHAYVSSWAIDTGDGLILIDALQNPEEAQRIIIPGLAAFGFSGSDIKALIITHEHFDHYGGALYLQSTFGTRVYATEEAWRTMANVRGTPSKDDVLEDGGIVQVGNTSIIIAKTPGHTPGTASFIFPVKDRGVAYTAGLWGGLGLPGSAEAMSQQIESYRKFRSIAERHGVDVLMGNHQTHDLSAQNLDLLRYRTCDENECSIQNPYIVTTEKYSRFTRVMEMCVRIAAARRGYNLRV
ncbi:beta-lactamase-like protein [Stachybotrys elegans]|uniref:Beta-lactamase-like protein n=1 Tax=Stachybotrys elegans TaxID=80388 RepID=A0A8K0SDS9_9HYPO|nr:beta-lactamase-like protein [Stachybotrys elegans]